MDGFDPVGGEFYFHIEIQALGKISSQLRSLVPYRRMREFFVLFVHLLVKITQLMKPGAVRLRGFESFNQQWALLPFLGSTKV